MSPETQEVLGIVIIIIFVLIGASWMFNYGPLADDIESKETKKENFAKACKFGVGAILVIGMIAYIFE